MTKELKGLMKSAGFMKPETPKERDPRHMMFKSSDDDDTISISLCGALGNATVSTRKLKNVTCKECLAKIITLAKTDSYAKGLAFVKTFAPVMEQPDTGIMKEKRAGQLTKRAQAHTKNARFLKENMMKDVKEIPTNMIGSTKEVYYSNLLQHNLVDEEGNPILFTLDNLQRRIDGVAEHELM